MIVQIASFASVPIFGYITDKLSTGSELIFAYGVRAAAGYAFYMTGGPEKVKII